MNQGAHTIRKLRMEKNISIRKLAEMVDVNYVFLSKAERGLEKPGEDLIRRIAGSLEYKGDINVLIARFGKVPEEIKKIIIDDPNFVTEIPAFFKTRKKLGEKNG